MVSKNPHRFLSYSWICDINEKCIMKNLIFYCKVTTYRAFLEALIAFYLLQAWIFFSPYFLLTGCINDNELFALIIFPLGSAFIICLLYMLGFILLILRKIGRNCYDILDKNKISADKYRNFENSMTLMFIILHFLGLLAYIIGAFCIKSYFLCALDTQLKVNRDSFAFMILGSSIFAGLIWNCQDFCADMRVNWGSIVRKLDTTKSAVRNEIYKTKYRFFIIHSATSIFTMTAIIIISMLLINSIGLNGSNAEKLFKGEFLASVYVILFFSSIILYVSTLFTAYYKKSSNKKGVYPLINEFICR